MFFSQVRVYVTNCTWLGLDRRRLLETHFGGGRRLLIQALSGSFFRRELLQFRELENVVNNRRELITAIGRSCYCKNKFVVKTNYNRDGRTFSARSRWIKVGSSKSGEIGRNIAFPN